MEEAAAKEVQSSRFGEMDQEDFEISDDEAESAPALPKSAKLATTRDISRLGLKDRRKLLNLQHPEMIPIVSHFSEVSQEFMDSTRVATKVLLENNQTAEVCLGFRVQWVAFDDRPRHRSKIRSLMPW